MGMFDLGSNVVLEEESDVLGGSRGPLESGLYDFTIKMMYMDAAASGAKRVNLHLAGENNTELRQTIYISSGTAKGGKFTYTDKKTGQEKPLPGYSQIDSLCKLAIGKGLAELSTETKMVNIYQYEQKKEVPTSVDVFTDLLGAPITAGVLKIVEDKQVKTDNGYAPNGETRTINEVKKWFHGETHLTVSEMVAQETTPAFYERWGAKNTGVVVDTSTATKSATPGAPAPSANSIAAAPQATTSLFGS